MSQILVFGMIGSVEDSRTASSPLPLAADRQRVLALASKYGARNVRLFGSIARGDSRPDSDIDLLVEMAPGRSYLDLIGLWQELEELLGRKVDLLTDGGLSPYLRDRIYDEAVPL